MKLIDYFQSNQNRDLIDKWHHYFDIYERHFRSFVGKEIKVFEIGIYQGGSLSMWLDYFGKGAHIVGMDIDCRCMKFQKKGITIYIGDQANPEHLRSIVAKEGNFDIIIDDGGHRMNQQIISFNTLYGYLNDGGVYLCEDLHTSYWNEYDGGLRREGTFIEFVKKLIDEMNAWHNRNAELSPTYFTKNTTGIHIYDSVVVFDKQSRIRPTSERIGIPTIKF